MEIAGLKSQLESAKASATQQLQQKVRAVQTAT
jgi:hypothetical protein